MREHYAPLLMKHLTNSTNKMNFPKFLVEMGKHEWKYEVKLPPANEVAGK